MPAPSQLEIATNAVLRLLKEQVMYRKELVEQEAQVQSQKEKFEAGAGGDEDGNAEYMLKQQQTALEQTKAVFGPLGKRIAQAVEVLEEQLAAASADQKEAAEKAQDVLAQAAAAEKAV